MMPSSACPQCAAPLPTAAQQCQFCGFLTPWGATHAAQQQQVAAMAAARDKQHRIVKAQSTAKTGMILALVGVPICCGPLSLVGGIMGYRGAKLAKAEGAPRPTTSVVAMAAAVLSMILFTVGTVKVIIDQKQRNEQLAGLQERLQGKRGELDQKVACDLVEEYLLAHGHAGSVGIVEEIHCDGALAIDDRRASLPDVRFLMSTKHRTLNACLEKRSRWFVIKLLDGASCADLPPPAPFTAPPRQFSDEEAAADEHKAREDLGRVAASGTVKRFTDKLSKVRAHAAATPGGETACSRTDLAKYLTGKDRKEIPGIDFDYLEGKHTPTSAKVWGFMVDSDLRNIFDSDRKVEDRAGDVEGLRADSGPLLAVFKGDAKLLPKVINSSDYDGGEFVGWLFIYDVDSATRLCQTKLFFESSDSVTFRKGRFSSAKAKLADAIQADFEDKFEKAAAAAIQRAAPDLELDL